MVDYHSDTLLPDASAAVLVSGASAGITPDVVAAYKASNDQSLFQKAFP